MREGRKGRVEDKSVQCMYVHEYKIQSTISGNAWYTIWWCSYVITSITYTHTYVQATRMHRYIR